MARHGCHNLPREGKPLLVQDGWTVVENNYNFTTHEHFTTRKPVMVEIPFVNSIDCRHDKRLTDPGCTDCTHAK
jgi:hypothetical protein